MQYLVLWSPTEPVQKAMTPERIAKIGELADEMKRAGILRANGGFAPSKEDGRVRLDNGKFTVTDGPFTEAKELIAGFVILEAKSRDEAIALAKRHLEIAGDGVNEIHPLMGPPK